MLGLELGSHHPDRCSSRLSAKYLHWQEIGCTIGLVTTDIEYEDDDFVDYGPTCPICDGTHGYLCPLESPDPGYYADEMGAGR